MGMGVGQSQACTIGWFRGWKRKQSRSRTRDMDSFLSDLLTETTQDNGIKRKQTGARKKDLGKLILSTRN